MQVIPKVFAVVRRALGRPTVSLCFPCKPVPASRPRVSKWGTYYGKIYNRWRREAKDWLADQATPAEPIAGPVAILTEIVSPKPKTTKRFWPLGDNDNFEKSVWDSITSAKRIWVDDDQIVLNLTTKRYARPMEPFGVNVEIYPLQVPA